MTNMPAPRTTDDLYEVFCKEMRENAEDPGRWIFYCTNRTTAKKLSALFMKLLPWITTIYVQRNGEVIDQYLRRRKSDPPGTADWWHVDTQAMAETK